MVNKTADVMVIAPHPDDAEYGIAGTVARWIQDGRDVIYVVCTSGDKGTDSPDTDPQDLAATREKEQLEAAKVLGVKEVIFLRYKDQTLEDNSSLRKKFVRLIRKYKPDTVATTDPYRRYLWHRDHRIAGQVVMDAVYPCARDCLSYPELLKEEGLEPHKVKELLFWASEETNYLLDITDTLLVKLKALWCHRSQLEGKNINRTERWIKALARQMAKGENFEYAEAFHRVNIKT